MVRHSPRLVCLSAFVSFCANWQFAYQITYVNTSARTFRDIAESAYRTSNNCTECAMSTEQWSNEFAVIISSFYPGSIIGFLVMPCMIPYFGTKNAMAILSMFGILGCVVQFLSILSVLTSTMLDVIICGGRVLVGIQAGASLCFLPLYIREVSPLQSRSLLHTFQQVSQALGTLIGLLVGSEFFFPVGWNRFFWLQVVAVVPSILLVFVLAFTPPTPTHLLLAGKNVDKVVKSLNWYHGKMANLKALQEEVSTHTIKNALPRGDIPASSWKGFVIGSMAALSYGFTADDLIDTFSDHILQSSQVSKPVEGHEAMADHSADIMSIGLGCILVLSSFVGSYLVDRFGRRPLLLFGLLSTSVFNMLAALLFTTSPTLVLICFAFTKASIGLGAGAPAWFLTSELVALPYVPLFQSLSTGLLLCSSMVATFFFLPIALWSEPIAILVLSSIPSFLLSVFLFLFLPETKDRTPREMAVLLGSRVLSGLPSTDTVSPAANNNYGSIAALPQ